MEKAGADDYQHDVDLLMAEGNNQQSHTFMRSILTTSCIAVV